MNATALARREIFPDPGDSNGCYVLVSLDGDAVTKVSPEDADLVFSATWHRFITRGRAYARRNRDGRFMHRLLLAAPARILVDHRNGDGLDNRRANLRLATASQNCSNRYTRTGRSRFVGVTWDVPKQSWRAWISLNKRTKSLGLFADEEAAARARDQAAVVVHGEFANLNFPDERAAALAAGFRLELGNPRKNRRLTPELVAEIRRRLSDGEQRRALCAELGIPKRTLADIAVGISWKEKP